MTDTLAPTRVLLVDDDPGVLTLLERFLGSADCETMRATSVADARAALARDRYDLAFVDYQLPDGTGADVIGHAVGRALVRAAVCVTAEPHCANVVAAVRAGAADVIPKPLSFARVSAFLHAHRGPQQSIVEWRRQERIELEGDDPHTLDVLRLIRKVAPTTATVLVLGESGTGKEVVAKALHQASRRAGQPFVALNCAAIPETLIESELFGHVRGAFTGADRARDGKLVAAHGGTLFLDEIGDMPLPAQAKLLRVLQERAVTPVGSNQTIPVDVRIVAATHQDLEDLVARGRFRADLYYRLSVLACELLPLRNRPGDVLPLARRFLARATRELPGGDIIRLHPSAEEALLAYEWPGNVRELANAIERAVAFAEGPIGPDELRLKRRAGSSSPAVPQPTAAPSLVPAEAPSPKSLNLKNALTDVERRLIESALAATDGNRTEAAALLGLNRTTLVEKLRKFAL